MHTLERLDYGIIAVSGQDATSFLQGQLTCDITEVTETSCRLGAYCSQQGRVQALCWIFKNHEYTLLCLPREVIPSLLASLEKYSRFSKVQLEDFSEQWGVWGLVGDPPFQTCDPYQVIQNQEALFARMPDPISRYLVLSPQILSSSTGSFPSWRYHNIVAGLPQVYSDTVGIFTPHELNLITLTAVSLTKGCYKGQEIVARMYYRGKLKQHMVRIKLQTQQTLSPGAALHHPAGTQIGQLIDLCALLPSQATSSHAFIGLAVLNDAIIPTLDKDHFCLLTT